MPETMSKNVKNIVEKCQRHRKMLRYLVADHTFLYMRVLLNVKIFHSESMSRRIFRHMAISTHKNVEISRAET